MATHVNLHLGSTSRQRWDLAGINLSARVLLAMAANMDQKNEVPASHTLIAKWVGSKDARIIYRPMQILLKQGAIAPITHPMGKRAILYMVDPRLVSVTFNPQQLASMVRRFLELKGEEISKEEARDLDHLFSIPDYPGMGGEAIPDASPNEPDYVSREELSHDA